MSLLEMFYDVDMFCVQLTKQANRHQIGRGKRGPQAGLCLSEIMTILIHFHQAHYRDFKAYYTDYGCERLVCEFPGLVSYTRFVELTPSALGPLTLYLLSRMGQTRGLLLLTRRRLRSVITNASFTIRSLLTWRPAARVPWVTFGASNCTWSSMTRASCCRFCSPLAMWRVPPGRVNRCPPWSNNYEGNFLAIRAISPKPSLKSSWCKAFS